MNTLHLEERERKSRRLQLVIRPSLHEKLLDLKKLTGLSVNEISNQILEEHIDALVEHYTNHSAGDEKEVTG